MELRIIIYIYLLKPIFCPIGKRYSFFYRITVIHAGRLYLLAAPGVIKWKAVACLCVCVNFRKAVW